MENRKWQTIPFSKLVDNLDGKRKPIKSETRSQGKYPYYGASGIIDYVDDCIYEGENLLISEDGANLVMRTYPIAFIAKGKYWVNNHAHVVCAKKELTTNKFLEYFFAYKDISDFITGAAQPKLSQKKLNEIPVLIPPLTEQHRIVSKLDSLFERIDKSIALVQENIKLAENLKKSVSDKVFVKYATKYGTRCIEELCTKITDGTHVTPKYIDAGIPFLSIKDMSSGTIKFTDTRFISEKEHLELTKRSKPERDDILYSKVGTTGIAKKIDTDIEFSIFVSLALLKPKKDIISPDYFELILNSPTVYAESQSRTRGVTNKNLVLTDIKAMSLPLPPLSEQAEITVYLRDIQHKQQLLINEYNQRLSNLNALKSSLLDSVFKGEL